MDNLATAEQAHPMFTGPLWIVIGTLARLIPLPLIAIYRALAVILAFIYLLVLWRLVCEVFERDGPRPFAFVIGALGSGFGAICDGINALSGGAPLVSSDVMPEMWAYHSFLLPNFTLALCLMALLTRILLRAWRTPSPNLHLPAAIVALLLVAVHPYDLVVWGPLLALHFVIAITDQSDRRAVTINLWAIAGMSVVAVLYLWQSRALPRDVCVMHRGGTGDVAYPRLRPVTGFTRPRTRGSGTRDAVCRWSPRRAHCAG